MDISNLLEFVVNSELEKFFLSQMALNPGDKLEGKIIEVKDDGRSLVNFGTFRALADIRFPVNKGETIKVEVIEKGNQIKLKLDSANTKIAPDTKEIISKIEIISEDVIERFQSKCCFQNINQL